MYFMPALLVAAFGLALCSTSIHAQTSSANPIPQLNSVSDLTQTPIPGAGHDYQQLFGETINNSNGSVSLKISFPMAKGRGISLPFAWTYNSAAVNPLKADDGQNPEWDHPTDISPGWNLQDGLPNSTVQVWTVSTPTVGTGSTGSGGSGTSNGPVPCNFQSGMTFTDPEDVMHNLYLEAMAPASSASVTSGCSPSFTPPNGDGQVVGILSGYSALKQESPSSEPFLVIDKNGLVYTNSWGSSGINGLSDRNGNYIDIDAYKDTLGNSLPVQSGSHKATVTLPDTSIQVDTPPTSITVNNLTYTADWGTVEANYPVTVQLSKSEHMGCTSVSSNVGSYYPTRNVLSSLTLPNGQSYRFYYGNYNPTDPNVLNDYGLLNEVVYPDGGWIKYTWQLSSDFNELATFGGSISKPDSTGTYVTTFYSYGCNWQYKTPVLATRKVSFDGSSVAQAQSYSFTTSLKYASAADGGGVNGWSQKSTTVTTTDNNAGGLTSSTEYTYLPYVVANQPGVGAIIPANIPVESSISYYDWGKAPPTDTPTKTVTKTWLDQFNMTSQTTTITTAAGSRVSSTIYGYGSPCSGMFGTLVYLIEQDDYDFGSVNPTKKTVYTYKCFQDGSDVPPKVASITIKDGAGAIQAQTLYGYDEYALSPVTAVQHSNTGQAIRGNLTSVKKCNPASSCDTRTSPITTYTYDTTGQPVSMTDPLSNTTTFSFADSPAGGNSAGNTNAYLTKITYPGGTLQKSFQYDYTNAVGYLIASIDENNHPTTYTYADAHGLNRLLDVDYPDGGMTTYVYNDTELSPTVTTSKLLDAASGLKETSVATMDGMGHVVETDLTTDPDGPTMVTTSYDGEGHPRVVSNPYRSSPDGHTTYYYDAFGRQIKTVKQDNNIQQWCYNSVASTPVVSCSSSQLGSTNPGIWVDFTDENVNHWERVYNVFGDLTKVLEPNGTTQIASMETDYVYDVLNNLTSATQLGGTSSSSGARTRNFSYDGLSRLGTAYNPETGTISYTYDLNSNVSSKTDARNVRISYTYDALNRLLSKNYSDGITLSSCYQYGTSSTSNSNGRLSTEWTQSGNCPGTTPTTGFMTMRKFLAYDSMGRVLSEQQCTPNASGPGSCTSSSSNPFALFYLYNQAGNLTSYTSGASNIPTVGSITFGLQYGGADRLQSLNSSWNPVASSSGGEFSLFTADPGKGYTPAGAIWNMFLGNDIYVNKTYDNRLRITGENATHP
jgi:YD repeat-containing protein